MRKGDLVKLNVAKCFTTENGGERDRWSPLGNSHEDENGIVRAGRPTTVSSAIVDAPLRQITRAVEAKRAGISSKKAETSALIPASLNISLAAVTPSARHCCKTFNRARSFNGKSASACGTTSPSTFAPWLPPSTITFSALSLSGAQ